MENDDSMHSAEAVEYRRLVLEVGGWYQVVAVFKYPNGGGECTSEEEFVRLKERFRSADCPNIELFIAMVQLEERTYNTPVSFSFSTHRRMCPLLSPPPTDFWHIMSFNIDGPTMMIGTRCGTDGAMRWIQKLADAIETYPAYGLAITDKIFREALVLLAQIPEVTTIGQMAESLLLKEPLQNLEPRMKH